MILPSKHIPLNRSLSGIGASILLSLDKPQSVSETWANLTKLDDQKDNPITFDWFIITLSWLYAVSAIDYESGLLKRGVVQ